MVFINNNLIYSLLFLLGGSRWDNQCFVWTSTEIRRPINLYSGTEHSLLVIYLESNTFQMNSYLLPDYFPYFYFPFFLSNMQRIPLRPSAASYYYIQSEPLVIENEYKRSEAVWWNNSVFDRRLVSWVSCLYLVEKGFEEKLPIVSLFFPAPEPEQWDGGPGCPGWRAFKLRVTVCIGR